jgi:diguanylate cyclase (GGDEF)-like protein
LYERICERVAFNPALIEEMRIDVTISIGVSVNFCSDNCADNMLASADQALYEAKRQGRNQVYYAPHLYKCQPSHDATGNTVIS